MKHKLCILLLILAASANCLRAADTLLQTLQKALFEEEANHDLDAAIQAYQKVITEADDQRKFAATAVFRLGECYRKQGKTNEAAAQYQRILRDYSDQSILANLSQQNLVALGVTKPAGPAGATAELAPGNANTPAEADEVARIKALIKDSPDLINALDQQGKTPLHRAAEQGHLVVAEFLLASKADANAKTKDSQETPLHLAARRGHKTMVELLLAHGAEVNARNNYSQTPLYIAAIQGYRSVAEVLLARGADPNAKCSDNVSGWTTDLTPLHVAVWKGFQAVAQLLIDHGAKVSAQSMFNLGSGQPSIQNPFGTPLHYAAQRGEMPLLEMLLAHQADVKATNKSGVMPLHYAVWSSKEAAVKFLLDHHADVNAPIRGAVQQQDVNSRSIEGCAPLHLAVLRLNQTVLQLLLGYKPNVNQADARGQAALNYAYTAEIGSALLTAGADPNGRGDAVDAPVFHGVYQDSPDYLRVLLPYKPDLEVRNQNRLTPLQVAVSNHKVEMAELLLDAGADPNVVSNDGTTPLVWAIQNKETRLVELLLAHKANPNVLDTSGRAPLDYLAGGSRPGSLIPNPPSVPGQYPPPPPLARAIPQLPQRSVRVPQSGTRASSENPESEIRKLLLQAGASEDLHRKPLIQIARPAAGSFHYTVFVHGTNAINRFTLVETVASAYAWKSRRAGISGSADSPDYLAGWQFPDFNRVTINRLTGKPDQHQEEQVNLVAIIRSGDKSQDVGVEWGDVIEIPEMDHPINQGWSGLPQPDWQAVADLLKRTVTLVIKGQTNQIALVPDVDLRLVGALAEGSETTLTLKGYWLRKIVYDSKLLRASSDTTRVRVNRTDPSTKEQKQWVFDISAPLANSNDDLWLRDGDLIEVPEKP